MKDDYFYYYILSYFKIEKIITASQILHVFHAKRTPSMFYLVEMNNWHHGFSLTNKTSHKQLSQWLEDLKHQGMLAAKEKGYILTEKGKKAQDNYFLNHYYPEKITSFTNAKVRIPFWNRLQLFTQAFSEYSYQNSRYSPIIKHPRHQESVRQLFRQFLENKEELLKQWSREQHFLFSHLESKTADLLANQLTGHASVGKTRSQLADFYQLTPWEFSFYFMDTVEELLQLLETKAEEVPLHQEILKVLYQETHLGLSASTFETYQLLQAGKKIYEIAALRSIKENTVREHILEMAFVFSSFPYQSFVPPIIYEKLNQGFSEHEAFNYQIAASEIGALKFMHYRLVELERMRSK